MSQYLLASHVYLCVTDDHGVLLDLRRDKYVGLGRGQMRMLAECVKGWPAIEHDASIERRAASKADSFIATLVGSGVLTTDDAGGKEASPISLPRPRTTLATLDLAPAGNALEWRPTIRPGHVLNFFRASLRARAALRWHPIAAVVAKVSARKARHTTANRLDLEAARTLVAAFVHLRPFLFTTKDACIADSLALVNFLAHYKLFPTWVFGVQTGPFAAHCWVQEGDTVFNDTPEHVRRYTPIFAI